MRRNAQLYFTGEGWDGGRMGHCLCLAASERHLPLFARMRSRLAAICLSHHHTAAGDTDAFVRNVGGGMVLRPRLDTWITHSWQSRSLEIDRR